MLFEREEVPLVELHEQGRDGQRRWKKAERGKVARRMDRSGGSRRREAELERGGGGAEETVLRLM